MWVTRNNKAEYKIRWKYPKKEAIHSVLVEGIKKWFTKSRPWCWILCKTNTRNHTYTLHEDLIILTLTFTRIAAEQNDCQTPEHFGCQMAGVRDRQK